MGTIDRKFQPYCTGGDRCLVQLDITVGVPESRWLRSGIRDDYGNKALWVGWGDCRNEGGTHSLDIRCCCGTNPHADSFLKVVSEDIDWRIADSRTEDRGNTTQRRRHW